MSKSRLIGITLLIALLLPSLPQSSLPQPWVLAQGCDSMESALQDTQENCSHGRIDEACYGNPELTPTFSSGYGDSDFNPSNRWANIGAFRELRVDNTGVVVMVLQPVGAASPVRLTIFGGASTSLTAAPESIGLKTWGSDFCSDMPAVMVAYVPNGQSSQFTVNGVLVELAGTTVISRGMKTVGGSRGVSSRMVFASNRDGNWEIYAMDLNTLSPTRLTLNSVFDNAPRLSPDGSRIVYHSGPEVDDFGTEPGTELYIMNADGSNPRRLTNNDVSDALASWSPDGTRLTFVSMRDGNQEIYTMASDGSDVTRLTYDNAVDSWPVWSPDGSRIAFYRRGGGVAHIYVMNTDGSNQHPITSGDCYDQVPSWSPDSSHIAFASTRDDPNGYWHIYVVSAGGGTLFRISQQISWAPAWTPDGRIVYMSNRDGDQELFINDISGSNERRLTDNKTNEENPNMAFGQQATTADVMTVANRQGTVWVTASSQSQQLSPGEAIDINLSAPSPTIVSSVYGNSPLPYYDLVGVAESLLGAISVDSGD